MDEDKQEQLDVIPFTTMLQSVWVKIEVDENGTVNGIDGDNDGMVNGINVDNGGAPKSPIKPKQTRSSKARKKPEANLFCDFCDYKTAFRRCLYFHKFNHTNPKPLTCDFCSYSTKYPASMQRHVISKHKAKEALPTFKCPDCPYKSIFKSNLAAHRRKHSLDKKYKCLLCEFSTAYSSIFVKHNRVHHPMEAMSYNCDKCPFIAKSEGYMVRHLAQVHKEVTEKAAKCENCNFLTKVRWRLNIHRKRSLQENPVKCKECDLAFLYMCELKMHRHSHKKAKSDNVSNIRTDVFTLNVDTPSNVDGPTKPKFHDKANQKRVTDVEVEWKDIPVYELPGEEKPFQCSMCMYTSKFKAAVQRHFQRQHTSSNIKPYKCLNCDFSTKTKDQMSLHNKRSKNIVPLCCDGCSFTTHFKCQLVMHQKIHYPFKCKSCDYCCRNNYYLRKHYYTVHQTNI